MQAEKRRFACSKHLILEGAYKVSQGRDGEQVSRLADPEVPRVPLMSSLETKQKANFRLCF